MKILNSLKYIWVTLSIMIGSTAYAGDLEIIIAGVESAKGNVRVAVFTSDAGWPSDDPRYAGTFIQTSVDEMTIPKEIKVVFANLPPGYYAVSAYHDEDANGALNTNLFGIPNENYGFSNGASKFKQALVKVGMKPITQINIQLVD